MPCSAGSIILYIPAVFRIFGVNYGDFEENRFAEKYKIYFKDTLIKAQLAIHSRENTPTERL